MVRGSLESNQFWTHLRSLRRVLDLVAQVATGIQVSPVLMAVHMTRFRPQAPQADGLTCSPEELQLPG